MLILRSEALVIQKERVTLLDVPYPHGSKNVQSVTKQIFDYAHLMCRISNRADDITSRIKTEASFAVIYLQRFGSWHN